jgi:hypothetical protein
MQATQDKTRERNKIKQRKKNTVKILRRENKKNQS